MMLLLLLALAVLPCPHPHRNKDVARQFARTHPCPAECATYRKRGDSFVLFQRCGACRVDHTIPLACCGPDTAANLGWQTVEDAKAKDRTELQCAKR